MEARHLNRRVAAWLLSLPGPLEAADPDGALSEAQRSFDGRIPLARFEEALRDCGYTVRPLNELSFELTPLATD